MGRTTKKILFILMIFILMLTGMSTIVKAEDMEFALSESKVNVSLNGTKFISYSNKPEEEIITWSSSDETIATVSNGTITGLKIGKATITAKAGSKTANCEVTVVYNNIEIRSSLGKSISNTNLVLGEHPTESFIAIVEDGDFQKIENANVTWTSSNPNVVTVDNTGKITGISVGKATITAQAAGVTDTCEVNVIGAPKVTDFSKAKCELLFDIDVDLKITGITPIEKNNYYYIITPNKTKPQISNTTYGTIDTKVTTEAKFLTCNMDENYIYGRNLDKYVELNQDLYLWIIEESKLDASYTENGENYISYVTKFVLEGQKLTRPQLPQLNLILKSLSISGGGKEMENHSSIYFRFPSAVENRKFKLKIGKITDKAILQKIQKNDYSGITELLQYAKNNKAVYTADLVTTGENYYRNEQALFDGIKMLENREYYFIYAGFDDENGKYCPIEGVTLGQAWISSTKEFWDIYAYTTEDFEWNNLSSTDSENDTKPKDDTVAKDNLPNTGAQILLIISIFILSGAIVTFKIINNKYKGI